MKFILKILNCFITPLGRNLTLYIFCNIFLFIPTLVFYGFEHVAWMLLHLQPTIIQNLVLSIWTTYSCFAFANAVDRVHRKAGSSIRLLTFLVAYGLSFVNVFLHIAFNIDLHYYALVLMHETTPTESSEFISTYLFSPSMYITAIYMIVVPLLLYVLFISIRHVVIKIAEKKGSNEPHTLSHYYPYMGGAILSTLLIFPSMLQWFSHVYIYNYNRCPFVRNPIFLLYNGIGIYKENELQNKMCLEQCKKVSSNVCSNTSSNIVLIIGESYNRHHASLYGYHLPTTSPLDTISNITVFSDVITPANATAQAFRLMFSTYENSPDCKWYEGPMFPVIFKKAGYDVNFWSTQFPYGAIMDANNSNVAYFNKKELSDLCFTHRNSTKCQYDEEMINDYIAQQEKIASNHPTLSIFHLYGQHVAPRGRFPEGHERFTVKDYSNRNLTDEQRQQVADYDNATLYNSEQIARIIDLYRDKDAIVIYFADHGDEANDFRSHVGRSYDFPGHGSEVVHNQFDIPFLIYTSELYINKHPKIVEALASAKDRPYSIDAISHLMFFLAGIETKWYNPTLNLLSPEYCRTERLIYNLTTYTYHSYNELTK